MTLLVFILTMLPGVQRWSCEKLTTELSERLGIKITADKFRYFPFTTVALYDISVFDLQEDTLLSAKSMKIDFTLNTFWGDVFALSELAFDNVVVKVNKRSSGEYNYTDLMSLQDTSSTAVFKPINVGKVTLRNSEILISDNGVPKVRVNGINTHIEDVSFSDTLKVANISYVAAFDELNKRNISLSCLVGLRGDTLLAKTIEGYYGNTFFDIVKAEVVMSEESSSREIYADVEKLHIDELLLRRAVPTWQNYALDIKGTCRLTSNVIEVTDLEIATSGKSRLNADVYVSNYKTRNDIITNINIKGCYVNIEEVEDMLGRTIADKKITDGLGNIDIVGKIGGSSKMFVYDGSLISGIGTLNLEGKAFLVDNKMSVDSRLYSKGIDLSVVTDGLVGPMTFVADVNGYVENDSAVFVQVDGNIEHFMVKGYRYNAATFNGFTNLKQGNVLVEMYDPNGSLNIIGEYGEDKEKRFYSVTAKVDSLNVGKTNLMEKYPEGVLSFVSRLSYIDAFDNTQRSNLFVNNLTFSGSAEPIDINRIILDVKQEERYKNIMIESDKLNGSVYGEFAYSDVWPVLYNQMLGSVEAIGKPMKKQDDVDMSIDLQYSEITPLLKLVSDSLSVDGRGAIAGNVNSKQNEIELRIKSNQIKYQSYELANVNVHVRSGKDTTTLDVTSSLGIIPLLGVVVDADISNVVTDNCMQTNLTWRKTAESQQKTDISLKTCLSKDVYGYLANVNIEPSKMIFESDYWDIQKSYVSISSHSLSIDNFRIESDDKFLSLDGFIDTKQFEDTLYLTINKIAMEDIFVTDPEKSRYTIAGDLNASAKVTDLDNNYIVNCIADIDRFYVNGDNLQHLDIESNWSSERNLLNLDLAIVTNNKCTAHGIGGYDIKNSNFNIYFDIDSLSVGFLNHYLKSPIKHISGTTSGNLQLEGILPDINLNARLALNRSPFSVRQTMVDYVFIGGDSIILSPTDMEFRNLRFVDKYGNKGEFFGHISHNMFTGLNLNLGFRTDDLLVLETTETVSPTYYGTIYADGLLSVAGRTSNIKLQIDATARPNTIFNILPMGKGDMRENSYIKFASSSEKAEDDIIDYESLAGGVTAQLNVKIEPTSQICVIVNPRTNNMIKATGNGDLRLDINKTGDLNIYGDYIIENGQYNFSFENLLNKQFSINQGSSLSWDGVPYNARIDLVATYNAKASLYDLVAGSGDATSGDLKRRVPVNVNLHLTERLADPNIKFDIEIPSSLNFNQYTFDQYVSTDEEMNRQAISLLLSNRFSVVQESANAGQNNTSGYVTTTVSELVSNQISNWISQNKYNVNLGVNYRPGDEVTNEEYGVAMSTQIFDNKIILSGNIGYGRSVSESSDGTVIGDFDIEYKINKSGNLRAKAYTHSNNDVIYETSPTTQGIGLSFSEEFNTFGELVRKYWGVLTGKRKRENKDEKK